MSPFEVNEEGIWTICKAKPVDGGAPYWIVCGRIRKKETPRYEQWEEVVEAMEQLNAEKPEKRLPFLRERLNHKTTEVACWAMGAISALETPDATEYLDALAAKPDPKLPVQVQIALDRVLCKRMEGEWADSKPRADMLRAWVQGKPAEYDSGAILSRLYNAHQDRKLSDKLSVELGRTAGENKD